MRDELDPLALRTFITAMSEGNDNALDKAAHQLTHFVADADIRAADPDYDLWSREAIRKSLEALKARD